VIVSAKESSSPLTNGIAFIFRTGERDIPPEALLRAFKNDQEKAQDLWVVLRCDFVIDVNEKAVDGEHTRGTLPSGDRPALSKVGVQGGLFESWFTLRQG
jgi:hypothetical protein